VVQDEALDELGLDEVGVDAQEGELGEDDSALGDGPDVALEAEGREVVEEGAVEHLEGVEVGEVLLREAEGLQGGEEGLEAGGDGVAAAPGLAAVEDVEDGAAQGAVAEVALGHREFVEVGEKGALHGGHSS